jgi:hypothetical protein
MKHPARRATESKDALMANAAILEHVFRLRFVPLGTRSKTKSPLSQNKGLQIDQLVQSRPVASTPFRRGLWSAMGAGDLAC